MNLSRYRNQCERSVVKASRPALILGLMLALNADLAWAQTNNPGRTNATPAASSLVPAVTAPPKPDESAFRIIAERNIFNANRSGGRVQLATRRPTRVEIVTLVGTMAYARGAFAFFDGSSAEFSKALQANEVIAGHKLVDVLADRVRLEADGKQFELPVGSALRREDAGAWLVAEAGGGTGSNFSSGRNDDRNGDSSSRSGRSDAGRSRPGDSASRPGAPAATPIPSVDQSEILKRLAERREKE